MHVILDYGMGNTASVEKAVRLAGFDVITSQDRKLLEQAETIIVPGVGTYQDAMSRLHTLDLIPLLRELILVQKKRYLGICLGMQILSDIGLEVNQTKGLGFIPGEVTSIPNLGQKIPHMGWNDVEPCSPNVIGKLSDTNFYFMHSFYFNTDLRFVTSTVLYGIPLTATVEHENIFGAQFHPEKSQVNGLIYLQHVLQRKSL